MQPACKMHLHCVIVQGDMAWSLCIIIFRFELLFFSTTARLFQLNIALFTPVMKTAVIIRINYRAKRPGASNPEYWRRNSVFCAARHLP